MELPEREPVAKTRPRLFDALALTLVVVAVVLLAVVVVVDLPWPFVRGHVAPSTWLAVGIAAALVMAGDVLPVLQYLRAAPSGVDMRASGMFTVALLAFAGLVPALLATAAGLLAVFLLRRYRVTALLGNLAVTTCRLVLGWGVLTSFGWTADLTSPWAPSTLEDLLAVLLTIGVTTLFNDSLVVWLASVFTGRPLRPELASALRVHLARSTLHELALTPVAVVVMHHVPMLTLLMLLPLAAVHRSVAAEQRSAHAATHDGLTQLLNRSEIRRAGQRVLAEATRTGRTAALVVVDLDRFKQLNDSLGHPAGDRVLVEVAGRLRGCVQDDDLVGRLGGDEFCVLMPDVDSEQELSRVVGRVREELSRPFVLDGRTVELGGSVGLAVSSRDGTDLGALYSRADEAMFREKRRSSRDGRRSPQPAAP